MTRTVQRILVPLDGSSLAELALGEALILSHLPDTEVTLLQVVPPIDDVIVAGGEEFAIDQQWERHKDRALHYLRGIADRPEWRSVKVHVVVEMGNPAEVILAYAESHRIDQIVMSTHGRTGVGRWVFGSVAEKVLRATITTLVLVRPPASGSRIQEPNPSK